MRGIMLSKPCEINCGKDIGLAPTKISLPIPDLLHIEFLSDGLCAILSHASKGHFARSGDVII